MKLAKQRRIPSQKVKARREIMRCFNVWKSTLDPSIPAIRFLSAKNTRARYRLIGVTPEIEIRINIDCATVAVRWEQSNRQTGFDFLAWFDLDIAQTDAGYACAECLVERPEKVMFFPTKGALFVDHVFNPLGEWLIEQLVPARYLILGNDKMASWAYLESEMIVLAPSERAIPIRVSRNNR